MLFDLVMLPEFVSATNPRRKKRTVVPLISHFYSDIYAQGRITLPPMELLMMLYFHKTWN